MKLCQLARNHGVAWSQNIGHVGQAAGQPGRCLEPDCGCRQRGKLGDLGASRALGRRHEAGEHETVGGKAGHCQRREDGTGTRRGDNRNAGLPAGGDKLVAGVGDKRCSGIADKRYLTSGGKLVKKPGPRLCPIMVMIGNHPCLCGSAGQPQQLAGYARVLAGDDVGAGKRLGGTWREIAKIADRCCNDGKGARSGHEGAVRMQSHAE